MFRRFPEKYRVPCGLIAAGSSGAVVTDLDSNLKGSNNLKKDISQGQAQKYILSYNRQQEDAPGNVNHSRVSL